MYSVSEEYQSVIRDTSEIYLLGTLTTTDGVVHPINDAVLANGSVTITMQSVKINELQFGGACLGQLDIAIRTDASRYLFFNAEIVLWCDVTLHVDSNGERVVERIPMGVWTVAEADRSGKNVKMIAYDALIKFDKKLELAFEGTPYEIMSSIARECGCELAEDEAYYKGLVNGEEYTSVSTESGASTYRDAVGIVAQMCGGFVQASRDGKLSLRQFACEPVFELTKGQRYKSTISDFVCAYNELEIISAAGTFISGSTDDREGMRMTIKDAPAWDYGLEETLQARCDNLLHLLEQIIYTPSDVTIPSDPAIDCGDMVTLYTDDGSVNTLITSYTWKYHKQMSFKSVGVNPYTKSRQSFDNKLLRDLQSNIDKAKIIYYPFKNSSTVKLNSNPQAVASVVFTTVADTSIVFQGTFQIDSVVDDIEETQTIAVQTTDIDSVEQVVVNGETGATVNNYNLSSKIIDFPIKCHKRGLMDLHIWYYYDGVMISGVEYVEAMNTGGHVISLYYPINSVALNTTHSFAIFMSIGSGGTAEVKEGKFIGAVSGQGLAAVSQWNGVLEFEAYIDRIPLAYVPGVRSFSGEVEVSTNTAKQTNTFNETFARVPIVPMTVRGLTEHFGGEDIKDNIAIIVRQQTVKFDFDSVLSVKVVDNVASLKTEYVFNSKKSNIDAGTMYTIDVMNTGFANVESLEVIM